MAALCPKKGNTSFLHPNFPQEVLNLVPSIVPQLCSTSSRPVIVGCGRMCGAYSAGDQGEATTYYQLPPPPSLQPCTWIGPPAPPPSLPLAISFLLFRSAVGESQSWSIKVPIPTSDPEINTLRTICIHSPTWLSSCSYCIL